MFGSNKAPKVAFWLKLAVAACVAIPALAGTLRADVLGDAADWPMWRYEVGRGATTPHQLADQLHLNWVLELPEPQRAWPAQMDDFDKLEFDLSYEPVVAGKTLYVPSMVTDSLTAYDLDSGEQKWRYYTDGPVRVAPAVWEGRIYVPSDDGYIHCLDAASGQVQWKFQGAPQDRKVLGNERLISMWSVRGGPVVQDGVLYFAAGMWPLEGVFIYALDAASGEVQWVNSGTGSKMELHPHGGAYAFGGVAPQGPLVIAGDKLLVPGGRTVPSVFDRHSGEFLYFQYTTSKGDGGYRVYAGKDVFFNPRVYKNHMYSLEDGKSVQGLNVDVVSQEAVFAVDRGRVAAHEPGTSGDRIWRADAVEHLERLHLRAGNRLYGSGKQGRIFAMQLDESGSAPAELKWANEVDGEVFRMLAARDRLFVVTEQGRIYCFGPQQREPAVHAHGEEPLSSPDDPWAGRAEKLLAHTGASDGYALMFGIGTGRLLEELLMQSELHIVAFDPDQDKVQRLREQFTRAGLYGRRVAVHQGDALSSRLPPYIASLIVSEDPRAAGYDGTARFAKALFHPLRPYGGAAYVALAEAEQAKFAAAVNDAELQQAQLTRHDDHVLLARPGSLPGSDTWTHQYSDAGNSTYSADSRVRAPLGISWFGGPSNAKALPRHMNGPVPQVVEGRLVVLGVNHLSARCVYTGRELWSVELPLVGGSFTSLDHEKQSAPVYFPNHPGANFIGSPYVSTADSIYIVHEDRCLRFDLDTGQQLGVFELPDRDELPRRAASDGDDFKPSYASRITAGEQRRWGHISTAGDYLIVGAYPHMFDNKQPGRGGNWNATSSDYLLAMDRHSGDIQWVHRARYGFRHNAIVTGNGRTFVLDNLSVGVLSQLARRGVKPEITPQIRAIDLEDGEVLWTYDEHIFGTWLGYSAEHDVLLQAGRKGGRQALGDEPNDEMLVLRGEDGQELWRRSERHTGPVALHADQKRIIAGQNERSLDLLSGEPYELPHPISGNPELWRFSRTYGCGTQNISKYLITFRSGAAGFYDLYNESGVGNLSGFRAGCTNNMVAADGVLNAPDYTRSCSCSYQHQTSLALVHLPDTEMWTYSTYSDPDAGSIRRVGVNLGAPGSRIADGGLMWINYPAVRRVPSPSIPLELDSEGEPEWFSSHALEIREENGGYRWVAASGVQGLQGLRLKGLANNGSSRYTVRLHFAEPEAVGPGERVFDVLLQGQKVLEGLDIAKQADGPNRALVVQFPGVSLGEGDELNVQFVSATGSARKPLLCGVDVQIEEQDEEPE